MVLFDASVLTDEALISFDDMMVECVLKVDKVSPLAVNLWTEVLKELDLRGRVVLISGSYDDVGNSRIRRNWAE